METVEQLAHKAMDLSPKERIKLVEEILCSLNEIDPDIEKAWILESEARYEAFKKGEIEAIDWEEIRKKYES